MTSYSRLIREVSHSKRGLVYGAGALLTFGLVMALLTGPLVNSLLPREAVTQDVVELVDDWFSRWGEPGLHEVSGLPEVPPSLLLPEKMEDQAEWSLALENAGQGENPPPGANFVWGWWNLKRGKYPAALAAFSRENELYPHPLARFRVLDSCLRARDFDRLEQLAADPVYGPEMKGVFLMTVGIRQGNWKRMLENFWKAQYQNLRTDWLLLTLLAGGIWTLILLGLRPGGVTRGFLPWAAAALVLGWMSTWPTLWSYMWMDQLKLFQPGEGFVDTLAMNVLSVGLREELCKLLLFTPLLPWVLRRGRESDALILGALVGLGFAVEENLGYLAREQFGGVAVGRFVSANLLHLCLTAANALALTRALRNPRHWAGEAVGVILLSMGLHGLYNALITAALPGWGDMSYFSGTVLVGVAYLFFRDLTDSPGRRTLSLTALMCWGLCLLFNLEFMLTAWSFPFRETLNLMGQTAISASLTGYIFIYFLREPLTD